MDTSRPLQIDTSVVALAAITALCLGWSTSALCATTTSSGRDTGTDDLRIAALPIEAFSVRLVDHVSIAPDSSRLASSDFELLDAQDRTGETAAPYLYLAPRVENVLREIFDATREVAEPGGARETTSSPVAETDRISDHSSDDESDPSAVLDNEIDLPQFQQRMFRTDI
ncbi:MAG: hypothetical protein O3A13_07930 [Proteobacteria bacterium]|nr:hypothetical protein [Pseudomonadota bacterium]MDA0993549.1 hypothetical protein [Pseudomonadota bacterium]